MNSLFCEYCMYLHVTRLWEKCPTKRAVKQLPLSVWPLVCLKKTLVWEGLFIDSALWARSVIELPGLWRCVSKLQTIKFFLSRTNNLCFFSLLEFEKDFSKFWWYNGISLVCDFWCFLLCYQSERKTLHTVDSWIFLSLYFLNHIYSSFIF